MMPSSSATPGLRRDAARTIAAMGMLLAACAATAAAQAALGPWFAAKALATFLLCAVCVWRGLAGHAPHPRFGAANAVTLLRLALVALLAAGAGEPLAARSELAWSAVVLATVTALLDAVDGPLARRQHQASAFGARFDMETDALFVMVLSVLVLQAGKAGPWVLAAGAMRYAFVAVAQAWPWLAAPLPASLRRKTVCVVSIMVLIVCLGPVIPVVWSTGLAGLGLAGLTASFAADIAWLARRRTLARA